MPARKKSAAATEVDSSPAKMLEAGAISKRTTRSAGKNAVTSATKENKASLAKSIFPDLVKTAKSPSEAAPKKSPASPLKPSAAIKPPKLEATSKSSDTTTTVVVAFEACKSCHRFALKARQIFAELSEQLPRDSRIQLELSINEAGLKVRRGAFEIAVFAKDADGGKRTEIWTGLKRGPPRAKKYPETDAVLQDILERFQ